jgi:hypothetical protein
VDTFQGSGTETTLALARRRPSLHPRTLANAFGHAFARSRVEESVATTVCFERPVAAVWRSLMFYEEVKQRPELLLRLFLPLPLSTQGGKTEAGNLIHCRYDTGTLVKRITQVDPDRSIEFQVLEQDLGIDGCISMTNGSYRLRPLSHSRCELVLTTNYRGHLRPRWLWKPFERYLARKLHHHILEGVANEVS